MTASRNNPIVAENLKPGTLSWLPERQRFTPTMSYDETPWARSDRDSGRSERIEGWCSQASVTAGDSLQVFVSMAPAGEFMLDVFRMGYYQRLGARQVMSAGPINGIAQPDPSPDSERLMECAWSASYEFSIPADWVSGVYLGKLTRVDDGTENYIVFVVRDEREAELIVQTSDFTWQAYNGWPTSYSLYSNGGPDPYYWTEVAVSFERPYLPAWSTAIPGTGEFFVWEFPLTYWLEKMGYDVTYCSNLDTHLGTAALSRAAGFLSVGHDEYWTVEMYANVRAAVDAGVSVGFFSGNVCWGAIGLRPSASGREDRVFSRIDRFGEEALLARYPADHPIGAQHRAQPVPGDAPDEGQLIGAKSAVPWTGCADWACSLPDHWVFEGTGMAAGDAIPNLVGHEWHGHPAEDIEGLEVVSRGTTHDPSLGPGEYTATVYPGPKGNVVFNASTCWWATGLAQPPGYQRPSFQDMPSARPDARVQRITENVLSKMLASRA
ncbi:N,N-dimethylformamidase beta subunit family domain-containing protein [Kribbella speibonae]|uniref:N,N-dimethylformamidase beta subunit-like C-terminal domain-containing protein n=1 Tax=Kribbella speibonae TaxID=1572660 RepID=A0A4R0IRM2_9ACTN|nr:N,N-dimethylformamidase beta subunit family domain-containing protein [Kribbella speibonae]TCC36443.1 hypothetical protein E0H92_27820 [Kribbella speibonae]